MNVGDPIAVETTPVVTELSPLPPTRDPETPGLVADLDNYLPTQDAWVELAQYETHQWLSIESVATPTLWAEAEVQAGDELLPGTTAFTIHGSRHSSGIWEGEPVASDEFVWKARFVVFTVAIWQSAMTGPPIVGPVSAVVLTGILAMTYLSPICARHWERHVTQVADNGLVDRGLGPAMASFLRRRPQTEDLESRLEVLEPTARPASRLRLVQ